MNLKSIPYFFIFDVESLGLHGEGFAVAGGIWKSGGTNVLEFAHHCALNCVRQGAEGDREWVRENVTIPEISTVHAHPSQVRRQFWEIWKTAKQLNPGIVMAAECQWPVEARFLLNCVDDARAARNWEGPYPIHEIASIMLAAGMDPMATYNRLENELPAHEPLADARQSARLLFEAISKLP